MNLDAWLTDTITIASQSAVGAKGDPSYGTKTTAAARVQAGRDRHETEIEHSHVIYTTSPVLVDDRIWLPGDSTSDTTLARRAVHVESSHDRGGTTTLYKVLL